MVINLQPVFDHQDIVRVNNINDAASEFRISQIQGTRVTTDFVRCHDQIHLSKIPFTFLLNLTHASSCEDISVIHVPLACNIQFQFIKSWEVD